ncbi:hypothetical protein [Stenotrophomonas pigmentata]|uniref:hypothetical protein n=1 Tax=Stenotrophomonas pigmentata TaxID=3055080 RepID=UPI0026EDCE16|nr:hypothetical protein [Stenotrophomonas sp. 610A2]
MPIIEATYIELAISMSDLVVYPDDDGPPHPHPSLGAAIDALGISLDVVATYLRYFDETTVGEGDVFAYRSQENPSNILALNTFRDLTDQLDIVQIFVSCNQSCLHSVRQHFRSIFDTANCKVRYEESSYSHFGTRLLDRASYPKMIDGYSQHLHWG